MQKNLKTTFSFSYLVPILVEEVLPGDHWRSHATIVARTPAAIAPVMDNWHIETFAFFVPCRLVWKQLAEIHGRTGQPRRLHLFHRPGVQLTGRRMARRKSPGLHGTTYRRASHSGKPNHRQQSTDEAYNLIWNQWFRDENIQNSLVVDKGDGPDNTANYLIKARGKRHDYFTSCLPWRKKEQQLSLFPLAALPPWLYQPLWPPGTVSRSGYWEPAASATSKLPPPESLPRGLHSAPTQQTYSLTSVPQPQPRSTRSERASSSNACSKETREAAPGTQNESAHTSESSARTRASKGRIHRGRQNADLAECDSSNVCF